MEWLEDEGVFAIGDADAFIVNGHDQPITIHTGPNHDRRAIWSVLDGVADEVVENPADSFCIDMNGRKRCGQFDD